MANAAELSPDVQESIGRYLDDWLVEEDVPGVSVAVFDRDGVGYAEGIGVRDVASTAPATPDTLFYVGSVTKLLTATAVLQLVERDAVALDDEVGSHVPFLADVPGDPITVADLLTHTSGMPTDALFDRDTVGDTTDLRRHVDGAASWRLTDEERFMYYNSGYKVLGELVAAVDGRDYADYVDGEILGPLGMERSTFDPSVLADDDDAMTGYRTEDGDRVPRDEPLDFNTQPADGGLISSVVELTRFLRCLLDGGEFEGFRILSGESVDAMCTRRATMHERIDGSEQAYGYGTMVDSFAGGTLVGHGGSTSVSESFAGGFRGSETESDGGDEDGDWSGTGVVLSCNGTGLPTGDVGRGVLALVRGESPTDLVPGLALREKLDAVTGRYESYRGGPTAVVESTDGHLAITFEEWDLSRHAFPESVDPDEYAFYIVSGSGRRVPVAFRETDEGLRMLWTRGAFRRTTDVE